MTFKRDAGRRWSPTDKMNVKAIPRNTRVRVDNIGGVGTTVNGIELIEVGGNSAGNFALTTGTLSKLGLTSCTLAKGKGMTSLVSDQ
ncbi:autotransporter outer membrane beta-barrel domain-containing protein [Escherichia coli]|nr:autotransporter outer membrane beta-barrel domain-containing protein [Escherichia coli]